MVPATNVLIVEGEVVAKERPRTSNGRVYTPRATVAYENMIASCAQAHGWKFGRSPLIVGIRIYTNNGRKPDLDNCIKSILDGLQRGRVFNNDSQVVEIHAQRLDKQEGETPRVEISMRSF